MSYPDVYACLIDMDGEKRKFAVDCTKVCNAGRFQRVDATL